MSRLASAAGLIDVDFSDRHRRWTTAGRSVNILGAPCEALIDSSEWAARHPLLVAPRSSTA